MENCNIKSLAKEGFTEKVIFEERPKEGEGVSYVDIWSSSDVDIANSSWLQRP